MTTSPNKDISYHSPIRSLFWHILPGVLTTIAFLLLRPVAASFGYPPLFAFLLAILLVDLPVLLGLMFYASLKENKRLSLTGAVLFKERTTWRRFLLVFVITFVVVFLLITLLAPVNSYLNETIFAGLPQWLIMEEPSQYESYPKNILLITFALQLVLTGFASPWVEELYFRGFLQPRLGPHRRLAPLLGGLFFGLYHVWAPHAFLTVIVLGMALCYVVWYTRDIRIPVGLHVFSNALPRLGTFLIVLSMPAPA